MKNLLSVPAYIWAIACLLLIPVIFIKNDALARQLVKLPFMKVHPVYSGGEQNRQYEKDGLTITVNKPVNTTAFGKGKKEMVQVSFAAQGKLPDLINQTIDYDFNDSPDFSLTINTISGETELTPVNPTVRSLWVSSKVKETWVVRVNLTKKPRP